MPHKPFIPFGMAFAFICMTLGMGVLGAVIYATIVPPKTEIVEVEVIKEVMVDVGAAEEPPVQRSYASTPSIDKASIVHKWIDSDNQVIVLIIDLNAPPGNIP